MKHILVPLTNHATLGDTDEANGTYAGELTHAIAEFKKAGFSYELVSIHGGEAPMYGADQFDDIAHNEVMADSDFQRMLANTMRISDVNIDDYDGIYYPGGFGLLSDLAINEELAALAAKHYENGGLLGAVCHGPAGLLPIKLSNGDALLATKTVTGFTRDEEVAAGTIDKIPFLLEEKLSESANSYLKKDDWQEHVIVDERVITGQNPASAHGVGKAMVEALTQ